MDNPVLFLQDLAIILISASVAGYLCRRIGLSPVVGYITAGLLIGTPEIVFPYVTDGDRIGVIAQLGIVFLMFSIGLQFNLRRLKALGFRVVISTVLGAFLILSAARTAADALGLSVAAGIALAAVFMNSSSAIISKIVEEAGIGYERHGQLALSTTLLEDNVAVVMLAVLGSYISAGGVVSPRAAAGIIGLLAGFAVLVFIVGSLLLPRLLSRAGRGRDPEGLSVFVAAVLLLTALLAVDAGFSLALGSFLFGMVVAQSRERGQIERNFQGLKDIFLTVFFVTIGMMVDVRGLPGELKWILLGTAGALVARPAAAFAALLLVGEHPQTSLRAALCLTPLGEFSFIIAGVAIAGGLFSPSFQGAVVGTVLATSLLSPLIAGSGSRISRLIAEERLPRLYRAHGAWRDFWRSLGRKQKDRALVVLLRKRLLLSGVLILVISTVLVFAGRVFTILEGALPALFSHPAAVVGYWIVIGLVCLSPGIAIWRNLSALADDLAARLLEKKHFDRRLAVFLSGLLRAMIGLFLFSWTWNFIPPELPRQVIFAAAALAAIPITYFAWRRFARMHKDIVSLLTRGGEAASPDSARYLFDNWKDEGWDLNLQEFRMPDDSPAGGMTLRDLALRKATGCSIVAIQRHGYPILDLRPSTQIFPGDELVLLGSDGQIGRAQNLLSRYGGPETARRQLESHILKSLKVPPGSRAAGKLLRELNWPGNYGVHIVAVMKDGRTQTGPEASTVIEAGDVLLLLALPAQLERLAAEVAPPPAAEDRGPVAERGAAGLQRPESQPGRF